MKTKINFLLILFLAFQCHSFAQKLIFKDQIKGGVVYSGFMNHNASIQRKLKFDVPSGSEISKIYLLSQASMNDNDSAQVKINGHTYFLKNENSYSDFILTANPSAGIFRNYVIDVTENLKNDIQDSVLFETYQSGNTSNSNLWTYHSCLMVIYKNQNMANVEIQVYGADKDISNSEIFVFHNQNSFNSNLPVLFSFTGNVPPQNYLGTSVYFNNQIIGKLELSDPQMYGHDISGVIGSFNYNSFMIEGIHGDQFNDSMVGHDGILNLSSVVSNIDNFQFKLRSDSYTGGISHIPSFFLIVGETNCESFAPSFPNDSIICKNEPYQMSASGGLKYKWTPQEGLSCYDCPNPTVQTDRSRTWMLEISNNDTCSKMQQVNMTVKTPKFGLIQSQEAECSENDGFIQLSQPSSDTKTYQYSLNGGPLSNPTSSGQTFNNLPSGTYAIRVYDTPACFIDTNIEVGKVINAQSIFECLPDEGIAPHTVYPANKSKNSTGQEWFVEGISQGSVLPQYTFTQQGEYEVQLVVWRKDSSCADTSFHRVHVYEEIILEVPNVFTPNADQVNDYFSVKTNQPDTIKYSINNRWGQVLIASEKYLSNTNEEKLWDGGESPDGTYFYNISFITLQGQSTEAQGFVSIVR